MKSHSAFYMCLGLVIAMGASCPVQGVEILMTSGWEDVRTPLATGGDYYGTLTAVGVGEAGSNSSGAFTGNGAHTNMDGDDPIGWAVGDYVFEGNFTAAQTPTPGEVLARMLLQVPANAVSIESITLTTTQDMEGTLEPDDAMRLQIFDVANNVVLAEQLFADDSGANPFVVGDQAVLLQVLNQVGLTDVEARLIYDGGFADGDQEEVQFGNPTFIIEFTPAPEPGSVVIWSLLGVAFVGFAYRRIRRRK